MAGPGSIGTDAYTRMINDKLIQLDTRFAIDNQYTPLIGDYSGLRGGTRKQKYITPGINGTQYPLNYPESYAISAGARHMMPYHPMSGIMPVASMISPVNHVYPTIMPMGRPLMGRHSGTYTPRKMGAGRKKNMKSLTMPGELDFTTKKGSKVHDIQGHYVRSLPRPYAGGKLPSLKDIGRSISSGFKKVGSEITHTADQVASGAKKVGTQIVSGAKKVGSEIVTDYKKSSPEFKMIARQVLPTVGSAVGASLGSALGTFIEPGGGTFVGEQLGSLAGNALGKYATRKIGLGRKMAPIHSLQTLQAPARGGARKRGPKKGGARHAIVKQVMQQHGLSLPMASKYVKDNKLY